MIYQLSNLRDFLFLVILIAVGLASCQPKPYYVLRYETYQRQDKLTNPNPQMDHQYKNSIATDSATNKALLKNEKPELFVSNSPTIPHFTTYEINKINSYQALFENIVQLPNPEITTKKEENIRPVKLSILGNLISNLLLLIAVGPNIGWIGVLGYFLYLGSMLLAIKGARTVSSPIRKWSFLFNQLLSLPWLFMGLIFLGWVSPWPLISVIAAMTGLTYYQIKDRN